MSEIKSLNLICGSETYLMQKKRDELFKALKVEGSIDFNAFSGRGLDRDELMRLSETLPFMQERRVIYAEDSGFFKSSDDELLETMSALPETTVLIFYESNVDKNNRFYKLIRSKGDIFSFDNAEVRDFKKADKIRSDIRRWARESLEKEGLEIGGRELELLLELCGYDMQNLSTEMEKLICYRLGMKRPYSITRQDVEDICSKTVSDKVFDMISAKLSGDFRRALGLCEDMLSIKTPPGRILYLLERQFNNLFILRSMTREGLGDQEIQKATGMSDWQMRKLRKEAAGISPEKAYYYLKLAVELETRIKTGDIQDRIALELLLTA